VNPVQPSPLQGVGHEFGRASGGSGDLRELHDEIVRVFNPRITRDACVELTRGDEPIRQDRSEREDRRGEGSTISPRVTFRSRSP
jgi:hypothetical protein